MKSKASDRPLSIILRPPVDVMPLLIMIFMLFESISFVCAHHSLENGGTCSSLLLNLANMLEYALQSIMLLLYSFMLKRNG